MTLREAFAGTFKKLIKQAGIGPSELRKKTGLGKATIYNLTNANGYPDMETLCKVCDALDISEAEFMTEMRKLCPTHKHERQLQSHPDIQKTISENAFNDKEYFEILSILLKMQNPNFVLERKDIP